MYDTRADSSFFFDFATKTPLPTDPTSILREDYQMKKVGNVWRVALVELHS